MLVWILDFAGGQQSGGGCSHDHDHSHSHSHSHDHAASGAGAGAGGVADKRQISKYGTRYRPGSFDVEHEHGI
jgi:hypothetical protein